MSATTATFTFTMDRDDDIDNVLSKRVHFEFDASRDIAHTELTAQFKDFLSACGYIFDINDHIGVINVTNEEFISKLAEEALNNVDSIDCCDWEQENIQKYKHTPIEDEM